jgi:hypothetical protein
MVWITTTGFITILTSNLTNIVVWWCQKCILLCTILTVMYSLGYIHRILWYISEREATKLLNGTLVTCSTIQFDLFRGKVCITNCIVHAPQQHIWDWEAPIFARIGKIYVEVNIIACLFSLWFLWEELPLDLYTIALSDIQVFIERKHNIYNFLLLDPHVVVPIPATTTSATTTEQQYSHQKVESPVDADMCSTTPNLDCHNADKDNDGLDDTYDDNEKKAQEVVEQIVQSVRHATTVAVQQNDQNNPSSNKNPVHALLDQYRHLLSNQLKSLTQQEVKKEKNSVTTTASGSTSSSTSKMMLQEGVNFIKHVTANIAEKTVQVQQVIVPERRSIPGDEKIVYGRIGRLLITDMRIFVREQNYVSTTTTAAATPTNNEPNIAAWNAPIIIPKVAFRANEFCPPLTAKEFKKRKKPQQQYSDEITKKDCENATMTTDDDEDVTTASLWYDPVDMPALYQSMDVYVDIIWKRILAEIAKSNTNQFFQTAMGEVMHLFTTVDTTNMTANTNTSKSSSGTAAVAAKSASSIIP